MRRKHSAPKVGSGNSPKSAARQTKNWRPSLSFSAANAFWWHSLMEIDMRSLGAFRLGLAVVITWDAASKALSAPSFYENSKSAYPRFAYAEDVGYHASALNPFSWLSGAAWPRLLFLMTGCLALGLPWRRSCSFACWVLVVAATLRNVDVMFIFDRYLLVLLIFSSALPYTVCDSKVRAAEHREDVHALHKAAPATSLVALLFRLQLAWIYLDAGWGKVSDVIGDGDWTLRAHLPALAVYLHRAPGIGWLIELDRQFFNGLGIRLATPLAAWAEVLVGPAMLFASASASLWLRLAPLFTVLGLHVGIALGMENGVAIGAVACVGWLALVPKQLWDRIFGQVSTSQESSARSCHWFSTIFVVACLCFQFSGCVTQPGPFPTVLFLNRWQVFSGADRAITWEVAPGRLANGTVVDVWSWNKVDFGLPPRYGRHWRWLSFPFEKEASAPAINARFMRLCNEWNEAHAVRLEKFQIFELETLLDEEFQYTPPTKRLLRVQICN